MFIQIEEQLHTNRLTGDVNECSKQGDRCLNSIAAALRMQLRWRDAADVFLLAWKASLAKACDAEEDAELSIYLGHSPLRCGDYREAKSVLAHSCARLLSLGKSRSSIGRPVGDCLHDLGYAYFKEKKYRNAKGRLMEAIDFFRESGRMDGVEKSSKLLADIPGGGGEEAWEQEDEKIVPEILRIHREFDEIRVLEEHMLVDDNGDNDDADEEDDEDSDESQ